jgi:hypothetical protein
VKQPYTNSSIFASALPGFIIPFKPVPAILIQEEKKKHGNNYPLNFRDPHGRLNISIIRGTKSAVSSVILL